MKGVKQPSAFSKETDCVCFLRVSIGVCILWGKTNCWCSKTLANLVYCLENLFKLYPITFSKEARRFRDTHIVVWWRSNLDFCRTTYRSVQSTIVMSHTLASVGGRFLKKRIGLRCSSYDFIVFFLSFVVLRFFVSSSFGKFPVTLPFTLLVGLLLLVSCWQKKLPLLVWNWTMNIEPISIKKCFVPLVIQTGTRRRLTENWWDDGIALQVSQIRHLSWGKSLLALNNKISTQEAKRNIDKHLYWYCNLVQSHSVLAHRESYFTLSVLFNPLWFFFSYVSSSSEHKINR